MCIEFDLKFNIEKIKTIIFILNKKNNVLINTKNDKG